MWKSAMSGDDVVLELLAEPESHLALDHTGRRLVLVVLVGARTGAEGSRAAGTDRVPRRSSPIPAA